MSRAYKRLVVVKAFVNTDPYRLYLSFKDFMQTSRMMSFKNCVVPVTLSIFSFSFMFLEAKPYGEMMPTVDSSLSSPTVDYSPWIPVAGGPSYNSYQPRYGARLAHLQSPYNLFAYSSQVSVSSNKIPPVTSAATQWAPPNPTIPEVPAASQWAPPNPTVPEVPAASPLPQPAPQPFEAPSASQWASPINPTIPEAPTANPLPQPSPQQPEASATIPPASESFTPIGSLPMWIRTPGDSPVSPPASPPANSPTLDVPAIISPLPNSTLVPAQPLPPPPVAQPENGGANVIMSVVQNSVDPAVQVPTQDSWPETPRVVPAADNIPVLPPATFGQFAVPPAR